METKMTVITKIIEQLNSNKAYYCGVSMQDARCEEGSNVITYSYPAPVISGAVVGLITVDALGAIYDDCADFKYANYEDWLAALEQLMEEA